MTYKKYIPLNAKQITKRCIYRPMINEYYLFVFTVHRSHAFFFRASYFHSVNIGTIARFITGKNWIFGIKPVLEGTVFRKHTVHQILHTADKFLSSLYFTSKYESFLKSVPKQLISALWRSQRRYQLLRYAFLKGDVSLAGNEHNSSWTICVPIRIPYPVHIQVHIPRIS